MKRLALFLLLAPALFAQRPWPSGTAAPAPACDANRVNTYYLQTGPDATTVTQVWACVNSPVGYTWTQIGHYAGPITPTKCTIGQIYFNSAAPVGQNLYGCTSMNTWTLQSSGGGSGFVSGSANLTTAGRIVKVTAAGTVTEDSAVTISGGVVTATGFSGPLTGNASGTAATFTGNLAGDTTSVAMTTTTVKVNGVAYAASPSLSTIPLITATNTATYTAVPDCLDTGGKHLNYNSTTYAFSCGTSGGTGGGASNVAALTDFLPTRTSATSLAVKGGTIVIGTKVLTIADAASCTLVTSGAEAILAYLLNGAYVMASNAATITCTGWTLQTGITAFPAGSKPEWTWTVGAVANQWDSGGWVDYRGLNSGESYTAGVGITATYNATTGRAALAVDTTTTPQFATAASADASGSCTPGQRFIRTGNNKEWVCSATDTWVRVLTDATVVAVSQGGTGVGTTLTGLVRGHASAMTASEMSGDVQTSGSNVANVSKVNGATVIRTIGCGIGDPAGSALSTGVMCYMVAANSCTITSWDILVDAGTATIGIWKVATGVAIPTVANSIIASAAPAIATGTAIHSTTMTAWTTAVAQFDIFGFNISAIATAKYLYAAVNCAQ